MRVLIRRLSLAVVISLTGAQAFAHPVDDAVTQFPPLPPPPPPLPPDPPFPPPVPTPPPLPCTPANPCPLPPIPAH